MLSDMLNRAEIFDTNWVICYLSSCFLGSSLLAQSRIYNFWCFFCIRIDICSHGSVKLERKRCFVCVWGGGLLSESSYFLVPWSNYLKSVECIDALNVGNPPVPLIFSLIIHATIPFSTAADVPIYARAAGLPLLLSKLRVVIAPERRLIMGVLIFELWTGWLCGRWLHVSILSSQRSILCREMCRVLYTLCTNQAAPCTLSCKHEARVGGLGDWTPFAATQVFPRQYCLNAEVGAYGRNIGDHLGGILTSAKCSSTLPRQPALASLLRGIRNRHGEISISNNHHHRV